MTLDQLQKIAERATQDDWSFERVGFDDGEFAYEINHGGRLISLHESNYHEPMRAKFDADFISHFNPAVALQLIADLRKCVGALESLCTGFVGCEAHKCLASLSTKIGGGENG